MLSLIQLSTDVKVKKYIIHLQSRCIEFEAQIVFFDFEDTVLKNNLLILHFRSHA